VIKTATCCAINSCLPGHARSATVEYEASGTMYPATQAPPGDARADTASSRAVWGLGKFRMRNIGESLLNLVIDEEPKLLNGSDKKVSGRMWFFWLTTHRQSATGE